MLWKLQTENSLQQMVSGVFEAPALKHFKLLLVMCLSLGAAPSLCPEGGFLTFPHSPVMSLTFSFPLRALSLPWLLQLADLSTFSALHGYRSVLSLWNGAGWLQLRLSLWTASWDLTKLKSLHLLLDTCFLGSFLSLRTCLLDSDPCDEALIIPCNF